MDWFFSYCELLLSLIFVVYATLLLCLTTGDAFTFIWYTCMCTAAYFDFIVFTATYCYVLQLETHVRLICAIKFYLLTYSLRAP